MDETYKKLEKKINDWWRIKQCEWAIVETSGTIWHKLGWFVHTISKCFFFLSFFQRPVKPAKPTLSPELKNRLIAKFSIYNQLVRSKQGVDGFIMTEECDSLLFSALMSCVLPNVNVNGARDADGWWHRRPTSLPECWGGLGKRGSTISRDMFCGLMWHLWCNKDLESAEALYKHAKDHNFIMGKGDPARLCLMPGLEGILAEIIYKLGGKNNWFARRQFQVWPKNLTHFELHLMMLTSLLYGKLHGQVNTKILSAYKMYAAKNPCNALHQYAYRLYTDGNMDSVAEILLNEKYWPQDRLPRRGDRKNDWILARDCDTEDYAPCSDNPDLEYTGGDFLWMTWLVLGGLK